MPLLDIAADDNEWFEIWSQRELPFIRLIPLCLLVASSGLDIATRNGFTHHAVVDLCIAAAAAVWLLASFSMIWALGTRRLLLGALLAVLIGLNAALVVRSPIFGFYTFTGYVWIFRMLFGGWRLVGIGLVAATSAISQTGGAPAIDAGALGLFVAVFVINLAVAGAVMWFSYVGQREQARREEAIAELTEANRKLEELQAQLIAQAHDAGIASERQRLAREIHDTLAQSLIGIITQLQAAEALPLGSTERPAHLDAAMTLARESLSEARRSVRALQPEPLESARLPDALSDVASQWSTRNGIEVSVTTTGDARAMRPEIEVALLRTAQEALANVAKHAHAHRVGVTLSYMEDLVTLDVRDDGVGFGPALNGAARDPQTGGFGLSAMRQRVQGVAGTLEIESEPAGGTAICASIPAVPIGGG